MRLLISNHNPGKNLFLLPGQIFNNHQQLFTNHEQFRYQQGRRQKSDDIKWKLPTAGYDTKIKIYNPIVREKVALILRNKGIATWYSCGPTVYDSSHIGHASCYVRQDLIQRILIDYFQINLITAMNITDIDDKIINRAASDYTKSSNDQLNSETPMNWQQIAKKYEQEFWFDLKSLNCRLPNVTLRVSEHIPHIILFIEKLLENSMAYVTPEDGSVYFHVNKQQNYGKLHNFCSDLENVHIDESTKRLKISPFDFALWKGRPTVDNNNDDGNKNNNQQYEPIWSVPWSHHGGRPGWHIECSTMASKLFGNSLDFHSGGWDLLFPHHENEEAQSCAHHCVTQWVNYWIHTGQLHLTGDENKMSKSLKNTITIKEMLANKNASNQFRMLCTLSNYQSHIDFSDESMLNAGFILKRFYEFEQDVKAYLDNRKPLPLKFDSEKIYQQLIKTNEEIDIALKDNFNTSKCIELLLGLINYTNKILNISKTDNITGTVSDCGSICAVLNCVNKYLNIFGFILVNSDNAATTSVDSLTGIDDSLLNTILDIRMLIRQKAIANKDKELFELCDNIRDRLKINGIIVKDHGKTSSWSKT